MRRATNQRKMSHSTLDEHAKCRQWKLCKNAIVVRMLIRRPSVSVQWMVHQRRRQQQRQRQKNQINTAAQLAIAFSNESHHNSQQNTHKSCDPRTARQTKCNVSSPRKLPLIRVLCLHGTNVYSDQFTRISVDFFTSTESHGMCQKMFYAKIQMITERFVLTPLGHVCFTSTASVLLLLRNHVRLTTKANREEFIAFVQRMLTFCVLHKIRFVFCLICCSCFRLVWSFTLHI